MIKVTNIIVRTFDLGYLDVFWEVEPHYEDIDEYEMYVLRSEAPEGNYTVLAGPFEDEYHFRDTAVGQGKRYRNWYYRIRLVHKATSKTAEYPSVGGGTLRAAPTLEGLEIARQARLRFQEKEGRKLLIYPKRTWGQRCRCTDPITKRQMDDRCLMCYGTGYVGGFHTPIMVYGGIVTPVDMKTPTRIKQETKQNTFVRLADFPIVQPNWMIVEGENIRWRVGKNITRTERHRHIVRQQAAISSIPLGDIEYDVPVNIDDPKAFQPTPIREFTNPRNMEQVDRDTYEGALRAYMGG